MGSSDDVVGHSCRTPRIWRFGILSPPLLVQKRNTNAERYLGAEQSAEDPNDEQAETTRSEKKLKTRDGTPPKTNR